MPGDPVRPVPPGSLLSMPNETLPPDPIASTSTGGATVPPPESSAPDFGMNTRAVRGAVMPPVVQHPLRAPLYQTSAFAFDDADAYAQALARPGAGYVYTRYENPTTAALEATLAELEGGARGLVTASGMAAISAVLLGLAAPGGRIVAQESLYGGTYGLLMNLLPRLGMRATLVDTTDLDALAAALAQSDVVALYAETLSNPTVSVADIPALAAAARLAQVPLVVDNTLASPFGCRPIEHGADIVVHSATKYLGGHSDVVAGAAVFADPAAHERAWKVVVEMGGSADPFAAWLVQRGLPTLGLRVERHSRSARQVADLLANHPKVRRVWWPGLVDHPTHDLASRLLDAHGGMVSFDIEGGRSAGQRFLQAVRVARLAPSLGGVETLVSHPASTTHRQLDAEALQQAGVSEGLIRVSVGLEDVRDIVEDFGRALEAA